MLNIKSSLFIFLISNLNVLVYSQGEPCTSHSNQRGVCIELPNCNSLISLYRNNPSQQTIDILRRNQASCGGRKVGRNPLMCCSDGVEQNVPPPLEQRLGPPCTDPNGVTGYCITIKQCPPVLNAFIQRQKDPQYVQYIKQSNGICGYSNQAICCINEESSQPQPTNPPAGNTASRLATPSECGYSSVPHNRVVGGVPARRGGWPWMALLGYRNSVGEVSFKCGGSIISNRHILTAAHCIRNDLVVARLGEHDISITTEADHIDLPIKQKIVNPNYDKKDGHSDIAILVLDGVIPYSKYVQPVCIPFNEPEKSRNFERFKPFAAGWGRTQEGGKSANVLQEIQLPVISNDQCRSNYNAIGKVISAKQFDDAVLCAGVPEGGQDTCNGDSGGPMMFPILNKSDGQYYYYQIGVVSYGIGCARMQVPGVYCRVQHFSDWIKSTVEST